MEYSGQLIKHIASVITYNVPLIAQQELSSPK